MRVSALLALALSSAVVFVTGIGEASPVGTAFTYQGRLDKSGSPSSGSHNLQFKLYDAATVGNQIGSTQTLNGVTLTGGLFTVSLDFGSGAFTGAACWLEIAVQGPGDLAFTALSPRQALTPAPYAIYALNGGSGGLTLPFAGTTAAGNASGFTITNTGAAGTGVTGTGDSFGGDFTGTGATSVGVIGLGSVNGVSGTGATAGVHGDSNTGFGVEGAYGTVGPRPNGPNAGVLGTTTSTDPVSAGARGEATVGMGVQGNSQTGTGVQGVSVTGHGVFGLTHGATRAGVFGQSTVANSAGVLGRNESNGPSAQAVSGYASAGAVGVMGVSEGNDGMVASSNAAGHSGIWGYSTNASGYGAAFANYGGGVALWADGLAQVKTLQILGGSDLAEPFDVAASKSGGAVEPGMVVAIRAGETGGLAVADLPYDTRVAGVISGAHGLAPGMIMKSDGDPLADGAQPVAMTGRVWCRVDADFGAVEPGDLLTTSSTPGHAMKAGDPARRSGAVLGKAMTSLERGRGLVLVLVSLQ